MPSTSRNTNCHTYAEIYSLEYDKLKARLDPKSFKSLQQKCGYLGGLKALTHAKDKEGNTISYGNEYIMYQAARSGTLMPLYQEFGSNIFTENSNTLECLDVMMIHSSSEATDFDNINTSGFEKLNKLLKNEDYKKLPSDKLQLILQIYASGIFDQIDEELHPDFVNTLLSYDTEILEETNNMADYESKINQHPFAVIFSTILKVYANKAKASLKKLNIYHITALTSIIVNAGFNQIPHHFNSFISILLNYNNEILKKINDIGYYESKADQHPFVIIFSKFIEDNHPFYAENLSRISIEQIGELSNIIISGHFEQMFKSIGYNGILFSADQLKRVHSALAQGMLDRICTKFTKNLYDCYGRILHINELDGCVFEYKDVFDCSIKFINNNIFDEMFLLLFLPLLGKRELSTKFDDRQLTIFKIISNSITEGTFNKMWSVFKHTSEFTTLYSQVSYQITDNMRRITEIKRAIDRAVSTMTYNTIIKECGEIWFATESSKKINQKINEVSNRKNHINHALEKLSITAEKKGGRPRK